MTTRPHLHVVDTELHGCPLCDTKDDVIAGLERDIRGWTARYALLKREKDQQAREHPLWAVVQGLYDVWRRECAHMRSRFTTDDFWLALPRVEEHGEDICRRAIAGVKFDPWITRRKNGSVNRHDDWARDIFKDRPHFEEACNKAPNGWRPPERKEAG